MCNYTCVQEKWKSNGKSGSRAISSVAAVLPLLMSSLPCFTSSWKGGAWEQAISRSSAAMESRNTRKQNKTEALGSNKQHAVPVDFYSLRMIISTVSKRPVYRLIWATVSGIPPLPPQWAHGEAIPFSKVCGHKEKTRGCLRLRTNPSSSLVGKTATHPVLSFHS